ncbi:uncharacterized protein LOC126218625 [Schistocerca nitens]|uniref:uncharacterized protein LOC126218625 n=1 Tax=Schistocerca nitens TaxID=7011 RepID=UPI0021179F37|nr:uncharacterized protein LOC126218625 [Schistocerca nitens]
MKTALEVHHVVVATSAGPQDGLLRVAATMTLPAGVFLRKNAVGDRVAGEPAGHDSAILLELAPFLGLRAQFPEDPFSTHVGMRLPNGSFTGDLADLVSGHAHVSAHVRLFSPEEAAPLETLYPHVGCDVHLLRLLLLPLQPAVWLALAATLLACAAFRLLSGGSVGLDAASNALFEVYVTFLAGVAHRGQRPVAATLLLAGVVVLGAFQGCLYSLHTTPRYLPQLDTLLDAAGSVTQVYIYTPLAEMLELAMGDDEDLQPLWRRLVRTVDMREWERAEREAGLQGGLAVVHPRSVHTFRRRLWQNVDESWFPLLHVVGQPVLAPAYCSLVAARRPAGLASRLDRLVALAGQAGLLEHWRQRALLELWAAGLVAPAQPPRTPPRAAPVVRLAHLRSACWLLLCGHAAAGTAFIVERTLAYLLQPEHRLRRK